MYKELVKHLSNAVTQQFNSISNAEESEALVSHWLHTSKFYGTDDPVFSDMLTKEKCNFLQSHNLTYGDLTAEVPFYPTNRAKFNFVDLFAGIGGFNLALSSIDGSCVFSSEWDKSAKTTYFNNYGKMPFGDINKITNDKITDNEISSFIPDHTVLAGGFPCQPFSRAGVSARTALGQAHGFECETQGTLFHSIARIAYVKQPKIVFMENVRSITTHNDGETFKVVRQTMETLSGGSDTKKNYKFFYKLVNSETLVPQRRVRCFMIAVREDVWKTRGDFVFPEFSGQSIPLSDALDQLTMDEQKEYTISDKLWAGHQNRTKRNLERNTGFTAHVADISRPSNTIVARYGKDGKECLVPQVGENPRKLTKNECRKLFGYPKGFIMPAAKTPTYKQFGNSVVVPVVTEIAKSIQHYLWSLK